MGARQGEGERLSNMHLQQVNAHNARRQGNMNMAMGGIQAAGDIASAVLGSDKRLKTNIELVGKSDKGYNIYEFDYINKHNGPGRYRGVMADEVSFASIEDPSGYKLVNYSHPDLDVKFERID